MLQVRGFKLEGTGGGCEALVARTERYEYLLTDGNLGAPKKWPCVLSVYNSYSNCVYCAWVTEEQLEKIRDCKTETVEEFSTVVPPSTLWDTTL